MKKFGLLVLFPFLSACDSAKVFEENIALEKHIWKLENHLQFHTEIEDTLIEMNIIVNIRHTARYPFSNLWLFVNTTNPQGAQSNDTLECVLAAQDGRWLGSGLGDIWDIQIPLKTQSFTSSGEYVFDIEQAMRYGNKARIEQLPEIMSVGLRIEKKQ